VAETTDMIAWAVIPGAFACGYLIVNFFANRMKTTLPYSPADQAGQSEDRTRPSEERKHAQILGLWGPFTTSDVQSAYRESLAQYDPEKIGHLGEEFTKVAEKKRQDITQAYEYFQRKYGII
jgi:hypothetical protein